MADNQSVDPNTKATNIFEDWGSVFHGPFDWIRQTPTGSLLKMLYTRKLLVFKRIRLDEYSMWGMCRKFGKPWDAEQYKYSQEKAMPLKMADGRTEYISAISNRISERLGNNEMPWHADIPNAVSYAFPIRAIWMKTCPNPAAGLTIWMNTGKAIKTVNEDLQRRWGMHRIVQQSWYDPGTDLQEFPSMMRHPITGEYCPRVNYHVDDKQKEGWIVDTKLGGESKGTGIVAEMLSEMEKQPNCVYEHQWDEKDLVIYDNYPFVHRRTALELDKTQERLMYRVNVDHLPEAKKLFEAE